MGLDQEQQGSLDSQNGGLLVKRFPQVEPEEEVFPVMQGYQMKCCDCGLVHELDFRVVRITKTKRNGRHEVEDVPGMRVVLKARRV